MSIFRAYEVDSQGIAIGSTSLVPFLYILPTSTNDTNIARVKVAIEATTSPAPPSNGSMLWTLNSTSGAVTGGSVVTAAPTGPSALAANTTFKSAGTALTGLHQGPELWAGVIPFTAGAWAEDTYENTGFEINIPASGTACLYYTAASGYGSGCSARAVLWFAE